jgi:hypothetical protein
MKILVICDDLGKTAPGIVYEKIIAGLSKHHEIFLITSHKDSSPSLISEVTISEISRHHIPTRLYKFQLSFFSVCLFDLIWVKKAQNYFKLKKDYSPDIILSLISNNHYSPIIAGNKLSIFFNVKHFTYSVDAIPAPLGWMKNDAFFRGTKKLISRQLSKVDGLFSANPSMLEYQLNLFHPKDNIITEVIYNPTLNQLLNFERKNTEFNTFLYTGGIYGPRKVTFIFQAFKKLLQTYPNSTLEFVGSSIPFEEMSIFNKSERENVIIHSFAKNLNPFFERATALIDIDSVLENDIFLSSKIINYLSVNRIIISETGQNSPSRKLFKNIPSIFQCQHDPVELANAMINSIENRDNFDFSDRNIVLKLFQIEPIILKLNHSISVGNSKTS